MVSCSDRLAKGASERMTSLSDNVAWLTRQSRAAAFAARLAPAAEAPLAELDGFGDNPGGLRALTFLPPGLRQDAPLVVLLHGCQQSAADFAQGTGWPALAERHGFALLLPEQRRENNPSLCFNWFDPRQVSRGAGEIESIRQMIAHLVAEAGIDRGRVHLLGLSAGGAMAASLLACHPELFAAGAIFAGLPHGAANSMHSAFAAMSGGVSRPARQWGDLVRTASPHAGPWPRIGIWHGGRDNVVAPPNAAALLAQWADLHGVAEALPEERETSGARHLIWRDAAGRAVVEGFSLADLGHGMPIGLAGTEDGRRPGPFMLLAPISAAGHLVRDWGLLTTGGGVPQLEHAIVAG
jgi:poly(hydroxyalkanoate) depolymerase family esterase